MNALKQLPSGIFAEEADLKKLSEKETASILTYSDSHGDASMVSDIFKSFGPKVDAVIFSGDGIYDLISLMEKASAYKDAMKCLPAVIAFVRGNNDNSFVQASFCGKIFVPQKVVVEAAGRKILVTHGHQESVYSSTDILEMTGENAGCEAVVYGHSHIACETNHMVYSINPGSITYPRANTKRSFAVLEVGKNYFNPIFYQINTGLGTEFVPYFPEKLFC